MALPAWPEQVQELARLLAAVSFRDARGNELGSADGFAAWWRLAGQIRDQHRQLFLAGNGASASMASHFAADLAKNARLRTSVFTDPALLTALGNDLGYEHVFAEPLYWWAQPGDGLMAISSSGQSPNILNAVQAARRREITVMTLSALKPENSLRQAGDLNIYLAARTYGQAETGHAALLHHFMDGLEQAGISRCAAWRAAEEGHA